MLIEEQKRISDILFKNRKKPVTLLVGRDKFIEIYGPGVIINFKKGDKVILKAFNYAEKREDFMVLIVNKDKQTIWVPVEFIDIDLTDKEIK